MCALHKQQRTLVVSSGKSLNIQINFTKHKNNKCYFPRGRKSLIRGVVSEVLASGKVVFREECTEGSQTAKVCTDEQVGLAVTVKYSQYGAYEAYLFG